MAKIGYKLSSEEHPAPDLVRYARMAEDTGFSFAMISDHFHPWVDAQGQSPFVWSVIGAIAQATERLELGTAVTCPTLRIHPVIIAQAAATAATLMPGRFFLGVGTGEALNEHVVGTQWPATHVRQEMLEEAIEVIRQMWKGGLQNHRGRHYVVENARIYSLPEQLPPIHIAVGGPRSAEIAGQLGDGMVGTTPSADLIKAFEKAGGKNKPRYAEVTVCWASSEAEARRTAHEVWPNSVIPSPLSWELPLPSHFEAAAKLVTEDAIAKEIVCGNDPQRHIQAIQKYADAGYDHVSIHQVGRDQKGFFDFYKRDVLPRLTNVRAAA